MQTQKNPASSIKHSVNNSSNNNYHLVNYYSVQSNDNVHYCYIVKFELLIHDCDIYCILWICQGTSPPPKRNSIASCWVALTKGGLILHAQYRISRNFIDHFYVHHNHIIWPWSYILCWDGVPYVYTEDKIFGTLSLICIYLTASFESIYL